MIIFGIARISLPGDYQRVKLYISEVIGIDSNGRREEVVVHMAFFGEVPIADMSTDI
jgi:hypothetical protein